MALLEGQGATEYLVLLAVVLIVALVSVALLGFFPGMASDAQITQSQAYWKSASPIAIVEMDAKYYTSAWSFPYLRVKNNGAYPIRITKLLAESGSWTNTSQDGTYIISISDHYYLAPGEEKYFAASSVFWAGGFNVPYARLLNVKARGACSSPSDYVLCAASSTCNAPGSANLGFLTIKDFGFEYIAYVDGQQITKRQIGKPLIIKCTG